MPGVMPGVYEQTQQSCKRRIEQNPKSAELSNRYVRSICTRETFLRFDSQKFVRLVNHPPALPIMPHRPPLPWVGVHVAPDLLSSADVVPTCQCADG